MAVATNPTETRWTTTLHPGQQKVRRESRRFNVLCCGRRWGKTVYGVDRALWAAAKWHKPVGWFAPTYKLLAEAWRELKVNGEGYLASKDETEKRLTFDGGGFIECWTLGDEHAGRGRKYRRVVIDEAAMTDNLAAIWWKAIRPTLTDYRGDALFMSTPLGVTSDFHDLYQLGQSDDHAEWASWQMPTLSNPHIPASEVGDAKRQLSRVDFAQEYDAEFVDTTGAAWFPAFDSRHVQEWAGHDPNLPTYCAIDTDVWTGAVFFQVRAADGRQAVNVFAEYLSEGMTAAANARAIKALAASCCGGHVREWYCDPAAWSRNAVGEFVESIYLENGVPISKWKKGNVVDGLTLLSGLIDPAEGPIRFHVHPRCHQVIKAFRNYARRRIGNQWVNKPVDPQHPHEEMIDSIRCGVVTRLGYGTSRIFVN